MEMEDITIKKAYNEKTKTYEVIVCFGDKDEEESHVLFTGAEDYATAAYYSAINLLEAMNYLHNVAVFNITEEEK